MTPVTCFIFFPLIFLFSFYLYYFLQYICLPLSNKQSSCWWFFLEEAIKSGSLFISVGSTLPWIKSVLLFLTRHDFSGWDSAQQSQPRWRGERWWFDGPECERNPHGTLRREHRSAGQHERQRQHHGPSRDQHHWKPVWQLLQQVTEWSWCWWAVGHHCDLKEAIDLTFSLRLFVFISGSWLKKLIWKSGTKLEFQFLSGFGFGEVLVKKHFPLPDSSPNSQKMNENNSLKCSKKIAKHKVLFLIFMFLDWLYNRTGQSECDVPHRKGKTSGSKQMKSIYSPCFFGKWSRRWWNQKQSVIVWSKSPFLCQPLLLSRSWLVRSPHPHHWKICQSFRRQHHFLEPLNWSVYVWITCSAEKVGLVRTR